jgi:hypothetical protein
VYGSTYRLEGIGLGVLGKKRRRASAQKEKGEDSGEES